MTERVNHPAHYGGDTPYEHVKVCLAWGLDRFAFLYNCTRYICRAGKKGIPNHHFVSCSCTITSFDHDKLVCHHGVGCDLTESEHLQLALGLEDLKKARWYLDAEIRRRESIVPEED